MEDLALWVPEPRRLTAGGREIAVLPLPVGRLPAFYKAIQPVVTLLTTGLYVEAVEHHYEAVRATVAVGAGVEPDWIDGLMLDELVRLAAAVVGTNADFFRRRAAPAIREAQGETARSLGMAAAGAPSSPTSPATAPPRDKPSRSRSRSSPR
jgi:hypothetical protein